jgi:tetratricopeptide (TPR) repeat protein
MVVLSALASCSGHQISSWSPSGSLEWQPEQDEGEEAGTADAGDGAAENDAGPAEGTGEGAELATPPSAQDALARADRAFAEGDMARAVQAFGVVFAVGSRDEQAYALYKIGWCAVNLGQLGQASDRMEQLLRMLDPPRDDQERRLRGEGVHDLALFESMRSDVAPGESADRLARVLHGDEQVEALRTLADQYRASGRLDAEALVRGRIAPNP